MSKQDEIRELEQRLGREIAIEYYRNLKRVVSAEDAEIEDYADPKFASEFNNQSTVL